MRHSRLRIVIAHLGQPRPEAESAPELWKLWEEQVDLGLLDNVWFDCTHPSLLLSRKRATLSPASSVTCGLQLIESAQAS